MRRAYGFLKGLLDGNDDVEFIRPLCSITP